MSSWDNLPNAVYIDRVLASVQANPKKWRQAHKIWDTIPKNALVRGIESVILADTNDTVKAATNRKQAWSDAWTQGLVGLAGNSTDKEHRALWLTICALIAYDDLTQYLEMDPDELRTWIAISDNPGATAILPAVVLLQ